MEIQNDDNIVAIQLDELEQCETLTKLDTVRAVNLMYGFVVERHNGIDYKIQRSPEGYYCGYVLVSNHPDYEQINEFYAEGEGILYKPHGEYTAYFGFDCAHATDARVKLSTRTNKITVMKSAGTTFKTYEFARNECRKIIDSINLNLANGNAANQPINL